VEVTVRRLSGARFEVTARDLTLIVDRLPEQGGPGDGFRPTELLLAALGACTAGTMMTFAENEGIDVGDVTLELASENAAAPTRIGEISVRMEVGGVPDDRVAESLRRVAHACRIRHTLERSPQIDFAFEAKVATP
jgi:putative redox protein